MEKKIVAWCLFLLYPAVFFAPILQPVLDFNYWHVFLFSILNVIGFSYFISIKETSGILNNIIKSNISIVSILFFVWAICSYFYSILPTEVLVKLLLFVNFYVLFINLHTTLKFLNIKLIHISLIITLLLVAELIYSYLPYFWVIEYRPYTFEENARLIGLFANRNVTSAIYLIQLPFVIYLVKETRSVLLKNFGFLVLFANLFMIFLLASRTAYVAMFFLFVLFLAIYLINKPEIRYFFKTFFGLYITFFLISFLFINITIGFNNSANPIERIQTIDVQETSTNSRIRYYKYALEHFKSNPFIGVGYGNWKIVSIDKDRENIESYIVPYTMHNDFLEVLVELGIIGFVLYILIFVFSLNYLKNVI